ncbi:MAG: menaquinone biosynthesis protein [Phycisphaerales bacterium]
MERVSLGYVKYLNTLPLVEGLEKHTELDLVAAVPAKLGAMLSGGGVDLALASVVDFASSTVPLTLVPAGGIGCDGPTLTVRLFSQVPLDQVTTLHADTDSHTSVMLARVLLKQCFGRNVKVVDFDARERVEVGGASESSEWPETLLLIGDKVVTDSPPAVRYPHQLDLGEQWKAWTGLPFVYAVWMCRAADASALKIQTTAALLDRQRRRNLMRTQWLIDRAVDERRWPRDLATRYVTEFLRYDIGKPQRAAVARFLSECAALGLLPKIEPRWAEMNAPQTA